MNINKPLFDEENEVFTATMAVFGVFCLMFSITVISLLVFFNG